jgi:OOP family OmpA-OmpF porin
MMLRQVLKGATFLVAASLALPALATAQPISGIYVGAGAGYDYQGSRTVTDSSAAVNGSKITFKGSVAGSGSIGYGLGNGLRFELEGVYLRATLHEIKAGFNGDTYPLSGYTQKYGAFVNGIYDINVGVRFFQPYIGAGVGYLWTALSGATNETDFLPAGSLSGTKGGFAYQAIAGFAVPIPPAPGLAITVEYHYIGQPGTETYTNGVAGHASSNFGLESQSNQMVLIGLRYAFNTPSPPPPPPAPVMAPAPAPALTYLVFFDWDKYYLTPRAKEIIAEAASNSSHMQYMQIEVNGYTDTSGTPNYNQALSIRRAKSVEAQLIADGVPASAISIAGYGETHLLVPTGPGVREPQNRRVEIIIK